MAPPPLMPLWFEHVKFKDLLTPDGTLLLLAELEVVWAPRWLHVTVGEIGWFDTG